MKIAIWLLIGVIFTGIIGVALIQNDDSLQLIEISCEDSEGCLGLIGKALDDISSGGTIQLSNGNFYEHSLIIDKDVKILGQELFSRIHMIEPDRPAIWIRDLEKSINVVLDKITIYGGASTFGSGNNPLEISSETRFSIDAYFLVFRFNARSGSAIFIENLRNEHSVNLELNRVVLFGKQGIASIGNNNTLSVSESLISADLAGILWAGERLSIDDSFLITEATTRHQEGVGIRVYGNKDKETTVEIRNSNISQWGRAAIRLRGNDIGSRLQLIPSEKITAILENNRIEFNEYGVELRGVVDAKFNNNEVQVNEIALVVVTEDCQVEVESDFERFRGRVTGQNNEISDNLDRNICPLDYVLPTDFISESE